MSIVKFVGSPNRAYQLHSGPLVTADAYGVIALDTSNTQFSSMYQDMLNFGAIPLGQVGVDNISAVVDPSGSNDTNQSYAPGSLWINTANGRVWMCIVATAGAATWALDGVIPGVGIDPSSMLTYFGGGLGTMAEEGNVSRQIFPTGQNPGIIGGDNVLAIYPILANSFDAAGRGLGIQANGSFANNVNVKRVKIIFNPTTAVVGAAIVGGTTLADSLAFSTAALTAWQLSATVYKYGALNSNTQIAIPEGAIVGVTHGGLGAGAAGVPILTTAVEAGPIIIAVTGNATTTLTDISLNFLQVNGLN